MDAGTKKALKVGLIVAIIVGIGYGGYALYKKIQSTSGDKKKNEREIVIERT